MVESQEIKYLILYSVNFQIQSFWPNKISEVSKVDQLSIYTNSSVNFFIPLTKNTRKFATSYINHTDFCLGLNLQIKSYY